MEKLFEDWGISKILAGVLAVLLAAHGLLWLKPGVESARHAQKQYAPAYRAYLLEVHQKSLDDLAALLKQNADISSQDLEKQFIVPVLWENAESVTELALKIERAGLSLFDPNTSLWFVDTEGNIVAGDPQREELSLDIHPLSLIQKGKMVLSKEVMDANGKLRGRVVLKIDDSANQYIMYRDAGTERYKDYKRYVRLIWLLSGFFMCFVIASWVYWDASRRYMSNPFGWGVLAVLANIPGLLIYLAIRPKRGVRSNCTSCYQIVPKDSNYCPHCGDTLGVRRCAQCDRAIEQDWMFCPECRMEVIEEARIGV